jgi:hypothetical protein
MVKTQADGAYYILGSPPPTFACPYCPRHFKAKSGRTRHIQAKHSGVAKPNAPDPDLSHISSSPQPSFHGTNPVSSNFASPPPDLDDIFIDEPNAYLDMDDPQFDQGPPGGNPDDVRGQHGPDAPRTTRIYHPKLDGVLSFSLIYIDINLAIFRADL